MASKIEFPTHVFDPARFRREAAVLIVGGGPVGLTLACELERRGVACRIVDRALGRSPSSRATDVHARTLEIFAELGVLDGLLAQGKRVRGFCAYSEGRELSSLEFEGLETRYPFTLAVPQRETEEALEARLESLGGSLERGLTLVGLHQQPGRVSVALERRDGTRELARFRWLVACDGVRSSVRELLELPFEGETYTHRYLVGDFDIDWDRAHDRVHLFMSSRGFANVLALPGGRGGLHRGRVLCDLSPKDRRPATLETMQALLRERTGQSLRLSAPGSLASFCIQRRLVPRYRVGSVFLAGDAAHTCSPLLGQGMNTGIQDANNLGWKLALVVKRQAEPALLDSYEAERRPVARAILRDTHRLHTVATMRGHLIPRLRDLCLSLSSRLRLARLEASFRCSELRQRYPSGRFDPTSLGARLELLGGLFGSSAGTRLPDVAVAPSPGDDAPWRLFDLVDQTRHTLLLLGGLRSSGAERAQLDEIARLARAHFGDVVRVRRVCVDEVGSRRDVDGLVHRRLGATRPTLLLVRPDTYVGARVPARDPGAIFEELSRLFGRANPHRRVRARLRTWMPEPVLSTLPSGDAISLVGGQS